MLKRDSFFSLCGKWKLNARDIEVPFPPESDLSGYQGSTGILEYISTFAVLPVFEGARIKLPLEEEHQNDGFDNISEAVFTGLRRAEGINYEDAIAAFKKCGGQAAGPAKDEFWRIFADAKEEAEIFEGSGLLIIDDEGLRLTEQGIDISNQIMSLFV